MIFIYVEVVPPPREPKEDQSPTPATPTVEQILEIKVQYIIYRLPCYLDHSLFLFIIWICLYMFLPFLFAVNLILSPIRHQIILIIRNHIPNIHNFHKYLYVDRFTWKT